MAIETPEKIEIQEEQALSTAFTAPGECRFYRNPQGFLALEFEGRDYCRVQLTRALPLSSPGEYICVTSMADEEIAVLRDLEGFDGGSRALLEAELELRYFYPEVSQVKSVKEKLGMFYLAIDIGGYEKTIAVKDITKSIKQLGGGKLILTDVDGNRFLIPDVYKINPKSLRMIEAYLY
ncbi:MAG: DUF1854 domain-containing protein [Oscillospiraceae bacterium]|nr:DUF1854 domain-containing protein [Oscillospiraceae bacterium]